MASCVLSHTPFFLPPLSSLFVQQEVGFAVRYTKPSVKNMETVNNAHRGWNDLLQSLFRVRTTGWALGEQPEPQSCCWLNQMTAFPLWHREWHFAGVGARLGCSKADGQRSRVSKSSQSSTAAEGVWAGGTHRKHTDKGTREWHWHRNTSGSVSTTGNKG